MSQHDRARDVRTGLFVLIGLVIFIVLLLGVAGIRPGGGDMVDLDIWMKDSGGVRVGDPVRLAGVAVGRVESITLRADAEWPVAFGVRLDADTPINAASRASFRSDGLLGARFLALTTGPSDGTPLVAGTPIYGIESLGLDETLAQVGGVIDRTSVLLDEAIVLVRELPVRIEPMLFRVETLLSEENVEDASATLRLVRETLEATAPRLPQLLDRLDATLASLEGGAAELPATAAEARALIADARAALGPDGRRLQHLLESAESTLDSASMTFGAVSGGLGEMEAGVRDLRAAAGHLEALARTLEERPNTLILGTRQDDRRPGDGVDR
ncbi:MAG: MlaD family protein [Acidobacteriota bacterium]